MSEGRTIPPRDVLAAAIYGDGEAPDWLTTVDGSPNTASYEYADRVLDALRAAVPVRINTRADWFAVPEDATVRGTPDEGWVRRGSIEWRDAREFLPWEVKAPEPEPEPEPACTCRACNFPRSAGDLPVSRMYTCATCGNKRCPHATDHRHPCTGSNEPGQPGSVYGPRAAGVVSVADFLATSHTPAAEPDPDPLAEPPNGGHAVLTIGGRDVDFQRTDSRADPTNPVRWLMDPRVPGVRWQTWQQAIDSRDPGTSVRRPA